MNKSIEDRIISIDAYIDRYGYESYDPYDGLSSPLFKKLLWGNQLLSRVWQQAIRLLPINIRPYLGIKKIAHTKAISDFASAYCLLFQTTHEKEHKDKALSLLTLLERISFSTPHGLGWGLRFPFATRFVKAEASQVNIFQTVNAIHSFLDGYETFHDEHNLQLATKGFRFLIDDLGFEEKDQTVYWRYWDGLSVEIFNVSGLMIGLCGRMWSLTRQTEYLNYSKKLFNYIKKVQNPDGSWFYSADPKGKFIDGFHTGYILEGICRGILSGAIEADLTLKKGVDYYLSNFFKDDNTPKYFHTSTYPIDGQNAAQAMQTLYFVLNVNFAEKIQLNECFSRIDHLLWNEKGYYNYKKTRFLIYKTPMHRWVTGPIFLALVYLKSLK